MNFKIVLDANEMTVASTELTRLGIEFKEKGSKLFITTKNDDEIVSVLNLL